MNAVADLLQPTQDRFPRPHEFVKPDFNFVPQLHVTFEPVQHQRPRTFMIDYERGIIFHQHHLSTFTPLCPETG